MLLINSGFAKWVASPFVIASPVSWYVLHRWLQNFAYKTDLSLWLFVLAGLIAFAIAFLTVSLKSLVAARQNPAKVIREE